MSAISGIEAIAATAHAPSRETKATTTAVDYGGAVTHRDVLRENRRVDPAPLANKKRAPHASRPGDPNRLGQHVDVKA